MNQAIEVHGLSYRSAWIELYIMYIANYIREQSSNCKYIKIE